jgi:hypothetical protein
MKATLTLVFTLFLLLFMTSCGNNQKIDYNEVLVGEWRLKNAGELQRYLKGKRNYLLKNAAMIFKEDGIVETQLMLTSNQEWSKQTGTWEVAEDGTSLSLTSDNGPFDENNLKIEFPNERVFYLTSNKLIYHFVKL